MFHITRTWLTIPCHVTTCNKVITLHLTWLKHDIYVKDLADINSTMLLPSAHDKLEQNPPIGYIGDNVVSPWRTKLAKINFDGPGLNKRLKKKHHQMETKLNDLVTLLNECGPMVWHFGSWIVSRTLANLARFDVKMLPDRRCL